jgi:hypothetical protein
MAYRGPGLYKHYKGGVYDVLGVALEEHDHSSVVVVYRPANGWPDDVPPADYWVRPLDVFNEAVSPEVPRFERFATRDR